MDEDTRDQIEQCLNCPASECWNCYRHGRPPTEYRYGVKRIDVNTFVRMYNSGVPITEMASYFHVSNQSMYHRVKDSYGLPTPVQKRPTIDWTHFIELPEQIQANLIWRRPT